ncbi:aspartate ammonia-lyase [Desulfomonile tiedjei]|uniref:Aspartate ammonia-lyase n=1 Tax=Desulfomonile tiedjei (strain ATCC 49306 / DSM 6799 / DCB-1) TaxID=706587 RepID=I4CDW8_DESTA|nr:aspartate ammonia-lyase [Desulfomonile tiedjei]AFM27759.1 aspartate ammonia-lyase [Desulfomonile tiedjei DSM 6799]
MRWESDGLGQLEIDDEAYYGIHTLRALRNFDVSGCRVPRSFIISFAAVKKACALTNLELGYLEQRKGSAILKACDEIMAGRLHEHVVVDAFQGGAGTSTNMNLNEVIANRAIEVLGGHRGDYSVVHPLDDVNMHQSTNDVYPTALRVAALSDLQTLEVEISALQQSFQVKEQQFRDVVKVGRTQLQDAVPITLGMEFGSYAEALSRDRWRIFKSRERIKQINLGGTAVGTGLGAPRDYIFRVAENLRHITGLNVARAENLVDATQNMDSFVESAGMLKAYASNLFKIASDIRLLSCGPNAGFGEIKLPARQAGSSIMAGKINPVIPEMVSQVALRVMANDQAICLVAAMGQLELNQFLPLLAHSLLESVAILCGATRSFAEKCVQGIEPVIDRCTRLVQNSKIAATVLVPLIGYENVERIVKKAEAEDKTIVQAAIDEGFLSADQASRIFSPKRLHKLGFERHEHDAFG